MFLILSSVILNECKIKFFFLKKKLIGTNLLKAPSRHKKFFHQIVNEVFLIKIHFFFFEFQSIYYNFTLETFNPLNKIFSNIGSNTLTRTKLSICVENRFECLEI
jgi:hypothetical protein